MCFSQKLQQHNQTTTCNFFGIFEKNHNKIKFKLSTFWTKRFCNAIVWCNPSLNTQSCIKGLLVVRDFGFWAVWTAGPVHKKKFRADYEQLLRMFFSFFRGQFFFFFENTIASALKSCMISLFFIFLIFFLVLCTFSNVNELHKSLLLQDWVFRLGLTANIFECSDYNLHCKCLQGFTGCP